MAFLMVNGKFLIGLTTAPPPKCAPARPIALTIPGNSLGQLLGCQVVTPWLGQLQRLSSVSFKQWQELDQDICNPYSFNIRFSINRIRASIWALNVIFKLFLVASNCLRGATSQALCSSLPELHLWWRHQPSLKMERRPGVLNLSFTTPMASSQYCPQLTCSLE